MRAIRLTAEDRERLMHVRDRAHAAGLLPPTHPQYSPEMRASMDYLHSTGILVLSAEMAQYVMDVARAAKEYPYGRSQDGPAHVFVEAHAVRREYEDNH